MINLVLHLSESHGQSMTAPHGQSMTAPQGQPMTAPHGQSMTAPHQLCFEYSQALQDVPSNPSLRPSKK